MTASLAMGGPTVERRTEDRWLGRGAPVERASRWMVLILLASVGLHAGIVATALFSGPADTPRPEKEIAVEIVQEAPKTPHEGARPPAAPAPKPAPARSPAKPAPPPPRTAEAPKAAPPKAAPQAKPTQAEGPAADDDRIKALQSELEALRAARAELEAERAAQAKAAAPAGDRLGPLPDSFQAVALPTSADGVGEAVGYQAIVFSQLAKAKEIGRHLGLPGSAGVRFEVDAQGALTAAEVVVSSGVPALDAEALAIVRRAAPFPAPPQGAQRAFSANVNFVTEAQQ